MKPKTYFTKAQVDGFPESLKERIYWALKHYKEVEVYQANGEFSVAAGLYLPPDPAPKDFFSFGFVKCSEIYGVLELIGEAWL